MSTFSTPVDFSAMAALIKNDLSQIGINVNIVTQDPVRMGLVASLARPGGNVTGINFLASELHAKRLGLLRELVPAAARIGLLVNPANAAASEIVLREAEEAARAMRLQIQVQNATSNREINTAFGNIAGERPDAPFIGSDPFCSSRRVQLVSLAMRHGIPTSFPNREATEIGGLMSYGANILAAMSAALSRARRLRICRSCSPPSSSSLSTPRPRESSASRCR